MMTIISVISSPPLLLLCAFLWPTLVTSQTYGNMTYDKLDFLLKFHDEDFDVDTSDLNNDYIKSVLTLPIVITVLLFLGILIFEFSWVCRCCCKCLRCMVSDAPSRDTITSVTEWTDKVSKSKTFLTRSFYCLLLICCLFSQGIIWSMQHFKDGSDTAIQATGDLKDVAISLEDNGLALDAQGSMILNLTQLAIPTCSQAEVVEGYAEDFETYIADYLDVIGPLPDNLQDLEDFLNDWTEGDADASGYVFNVYALFLLMTLPLLVSFCCKSKWSMRCSLCCGLCYIHVLLVFFCLYFIALSIMGDYCEAPTDNLIMITPDSVVEEATYFGTCNGTNPFDDSVTEANDAVQSLELSITSLTAAGAPCENNPYLLACLPIIEDMYAELDEIEHDMSCSPLQSFWGDIVNDATCHNIYTGLFILFWTVLLVFLVYFCLLIISSLIYQYFGDLWHAEEALNERLVNDANSSILSDEQLESEMSNRSSGTLLEWQRSTATEEEVQAPMAVAIVSNPVDSPDYDKESKLGVKV